ncbi:AAA family ATPase [Streptomyces sp. ATE26]|uniref:AAA family ATPase n=1 Tax=unclassified Streptomyces TaxID=2593676 RepID=UPI001172F9BC|nr:MULTISPECIES: AAA family ATPase [unclassified Streptomyces]MDI1455416.1 AAA family ATPase [Streptomyces sp. ATE26]GEK04599.1 hypothetical protein TNCT1_68750 [Streptomyces sp. 1-11]
MDEQRLSGHRALVVGVEGPRPDLRDESDSGLLPMTYAPGYAEELRTVLDDLRYRPHAAGPDPAGSAEALERALDSVLSAGPGFVVVHVLAHGVTGANSGAVYMVGGDGQRTVHDIEHWIKRVEDAEPAEDAPKVLFLLDLCFAGRVARLEWQHVVDAARRRAWVIAAGGIGEETYDGRLTRAVTEVLRRIADGEADVHPSLPYVPLSLFCRRVVDLVQQYAVDGYPQAVTTPLAALDGADLPHLTFFPNPAYERSASRSGVGVSVDRTVAALIEEIADVTHFTGRASGTEAVLWKGDHGFFRGRNDEVRVLSAWLRGDGQDVLVVTGRPGVGKSALLGVLVCAAHPVLRDKAQGLWLGLLKDPPLAVRNLAVVHARGRSVSEVMAALVRQWSLGKTPKVDDVVGALRDLPRPRVLVLDALDEAEHPEELTEALLQLGGACRMLIGVRSGRRFKSLSSRVGQGRVDLDKVPRSRLDDELRTYLYDVLTVQGPYARSEHGETARLVADGIARNLVRRRVPEYGEFLVAAMYARYVLDRPVPNDLAEVERICDTVPRDLQQVVDLHRKQHPDVPWLPAVLSALAFAHGAGMPEEVVTATAAAFRDGTPRTEQIRQALDAARFFLRRDMDGEGKAVYRLFHQGLADALRSQSGGGTGAVWTHLLTLVGTPRRWASAEPYLRRHAAHHAAEAGKLDELLADTEFVVHAEATSLESLLLRLDGPHWLPKWARHSHRLTPLARLYVETADVHRKLSPSHRRQVLRVAAAKKGEQEVSLAFTGSGSWHARRVGRAPQHDARQEAVLFTPWGEGLGQGVAKEDSKVTGLVPVSLGGPPHVVTASDDGVVRVWDLREGRVVARGASRWDLDEDWSVTCTVLDGLVVSIHHIDRSGVSESRLNVWDLAVNRSPKARTETKHVFVAVAATAVRDRPMVVLCGYRRTWKLGAFGSLVLWDPSGEPQLGEPLLDTGAPLSCVAAGSLGGRPHAVTGGQDGAVRVWDLEEGKETRVLTGHERAVMCVAFASLGGRAHAVTGGQDGAVRVWDLEEGKETRVLTGHERPVWCVALASVRDRPHLITGGGDRTLRVWDLMSGTEVGVLYLPEMPTALAVATDGTVVVSLADTVLALELPPRLRPMAPWTAQPVRSDDLPEAPSCP